MDARIVGETAGGASGTADPFGTAGLRRRVLQAWSASPARFREDANAEEELALGGYRDRLVVELAQNAADAAARAGVPGRLRLTLREGLLAAANTGAPLDAEGVESLSTLRASSKREAAGDGAVGRFGVGFAAVLAVSDEPAVLGLPGGIRWSLAEARALAAEQEPLAEELRRRDGHVPLLRLPFPAEGAPPEGYDTVVVLPLRDAAAEDLTRRLLAGVDDALLLTLGGLTEVVVDTGDHVRRLTRREQPSGPDLDGPPVVVVADESGERRWQVASAGGELAPELLRDRTVEERHRPHWSVTWAVIAPAARATADAGAGTGGPTGFGTMDELEAGLAALDADPFGATATGAAGITAVVHAPTPTDEPLGVPALLIASFPLDSTRRHIAPGPLTDFLVERAAEVYAALLRGRGADAAGLRLVPGPLGQGELDGRLRRAILRLLPDVPFLPAAEGQGALEGRSGLRPRDAVLLEGADAEIVRALAEVLPGLLPAGLERRQELRTLGVRRLALAETVDQLANLDREPAWWRNLYGALLGADRDALGALPVPLADGRKVTGPRRVLVPSGAEVSAEDLTLLGLRLVHPEAAHPLLEKLGAGVATPVGVLETPELRAAVLRSVDTDDQDEAEEIAEAVLRIVRAAGIGPSGGGAAEDAAADPRALASGADAYPWLAWLALPDEDGELVAAGELVLPGSPLAAIADEDDAVYLDEEWAERWGADVLRAVGVGYSLGLVRAEEVVLDPDDLDRLDPTSPPDRAAGGEARGMLDEAPEGFADWAEEVAEQLRPDPDAAGPGVPEVPPVAAELLAVRDLDLVGDDAWPQALALLAAPPLRDAVVHPVRLLLPDGSTAEVPSYTAWWLRDHPVLDGRRPAGLRAAGADPLLRGLYPEARTALDPVFLHALGVRTTLASLLADTEGPDELLYRMGDPDCELTHRQLHGLYSALAQVELARIALPEEVRALPPMDPRTRRRPAHTVVVDVADAVVADAPDLVQLLDDYPLITVAPALAAALAERLHVSLASEVAGGRVLSEGAVHRVPEAVRELLPGCPEVYEEHEELLVVGPDGADAAVDWRWDIDSPAPEAEAEDESEPDEFASAVPYGALHAATPEGLAAGLAWAAGQWHRRFEVLAVLSDPDRAYELSAARDFER
ncbi:sacsin N-terminal ATP-binding-like domain-containing protein [Streptacidiphilus sp. P02-A3a]|uniref:sacsin N-terminal ATP-binding-like domain-containing protein n=1 Tax=Streptacidiphilus sp. P02-A3a TaxID=2704468 RepID=UPI0015F865D8|nr:molecular chaperone Hsp90 [Streptacidiphilus sp. P02-A3a]QMU72916.1 molecular chaperone Hsp90 [Streptacidiphilus sp. P02-A3a]